MESHATPQKYTHEIIRILHNEFSNPSDEFVEFFARKVYPENKNLKPKAKGKFKKITKECLDQFLVERIKLAAIDSASSEPVHETEEWDGYYFIDPSGIVMREAKSHCPITFDTSNKKTTCRLYFNATQKYFGVFDNESRKEIKIPLNNVDEFLELADHFKNVCCNKLEV